MKRLVLLLLILLGACTSPVIHAQIGVISYTAATCGGGGCTTPAITTTGATGIWIGINGGPTGWTTPTDSKGNTWVLVRTEAANASGAKVGVWYCQHPCTVGISHTFTSPVSTSNIHVLALSGTRTASTPLDQQVGVHTDLSGSIASGNLTPSVNGCAVFYLFGGFNPGGLPSLTSGGGSFTLLRAVGTGTSHAGGAWYEIQTTATTRNVTGSSTSSPHATAIMVSIFPPAVAPTTQPGFFLNFVNH